MNSITKQFYQLKKFFIGFSQNTKGIAATEFALILPMLVATFVGTVEISKAVIAKNKVELIAESVSELVTRGQSITDTQLTDIFSLSTKMLSTAQQSKFNIVVTAVRTLPDASTGQSETKVTWSKSSGSQGTYATGDDYPDLPDGMAANYQTIIVTEMYFKHDSLYSRFIQTELKMDRRFLTRPRYSSDIPCEDCS